MQSDQQPGYDGKAHNQQQIMVVKLKQKEARAQLRAANQTGGQGPPKSTTFSASGGSSGAAMHGYGSGANAHSANYSQSQQTSASRRYSHHEPQGGPGQ